MQRTTIGTRSTMPKQVVAQIKPTTMLEIAEMSSGTLTPSRDGRIGYPL
jgi:hypothetical protein